ncbi:unnamed protein product [Prunus brigantina]
MKSIGEDSGSLNKPDVGPPQLLYNAALDDVLDAFFDEVFNYQSQLNQEYVEQVSNIGTIGTVEVSVELTRNVINE